MDFTNTDLVLMNVVRFLINGKQTTEANYLLVSTLEKVTVEWNNDHQDNEGYRAYLRCPRFVYDVLTTDVSQKTFGVGKGPEYVNINNAFESVLSGEYEYLGMIIRPELISAVNPNWREEMVEYLRKGNVHNQVAEDEPVIVWNNLRFRSKTERVIAEELDKRGILFFPNCMARLGQVSARVNREPDFLVCHKGKWGILEIDGQQFHTSAAKDHDRDRLFRQYGIKTIERYEASRCYNTPSKVVDEFLSLLAQP